MEQVSKLERMIIGWLKDVPHLPASVRKWLGINVWWIVVIAVVLSAIAVLGLLSALFTNLAALSGPGAAYYVSATLAGWLVVTTAVGLFFTIVELILMGMAITPLKERRKKGWVLLFATWLVAVVAMVVGAILTLNPLGFIGNLIFGTIWVGITGYVLFEMHGQFAHTERSKGVKGKK